MLIHLITYLTININDLTIVIIFICVGKEAPIEEYIVFCTILIEFIIVVNGIGIRCFLMSARCFCKLIAKLRVFRWSWNSLMVIQRFFISRQTHLRQKVPKKANFRILAKIASRNWIMANVSKLLKDFLKRLDMKTALTNFF